MPRTREQIKGVPLQDKPAEIYWCGMSHAKFAQHRFTKKWFELSYLGQFIGTALDLDYYRQNREPGPRTKSQIKTQELSRL